MTASFTTFLKRTFFAALMLPMFSSCQIHGAELIPVGAIQSDSGDAAPDKPIRIEDVIGWIKRSSVEIVENQKDFGILEQRFETAQVVGLGEATHGQHETFELKRRLTMHLIRKHGYRVVAYEANASGALVCNDYINGKTDDRKKAVAGLGMLIWQIEENGRLLDDLRSWNKSAKPDDQVRFIGVDAQDGKTVLKRLANLLGEKNSEDIEQLKAFQRRLGPAMQQAMQGDSSSLQKLLADGRTTCESIKKSASKQSLNVAAVDLRLQELMANLSLYSAPGMRDKQMAKLLLAQLDLSKKHEKCVFWGHNGHVQRGQLWMAGRMVPMMGEHLAKSLGKKYYALGMCFGQGEFQANVRDKDNVWRFRRYRHSPSPTGSMGDVFSKATKSDFILDFRSAPKEAEVQAWLNSEQSFRSWGGYNVPKDFDDANANPLPQCVPAETYDGIAFHHRTSAARPLSSDLILSEEEDGKTP